MSISSIFNCLCLVSLSDPTSPNGVERAALTDLSQQLRHEFLSRSTRLLVGAEGIPSFLVLFCFSWWVTVVLNAWTRLPLSGGNVIHPSTPQAIWEAW
jgi:hypothetical protein